MESSSLLARRSGAIARQRAATCRELLRARESLCPHPSHDLSLLHALFYIHSGKDFDTLLGSEQGAQATRIVGGMQPVATKLAQGLDVRLGSPVRRIEHRADGATIEFDGGRLAAVHVVVALPPKLAAAIVVDPSCERMELVAKAPMGP